MILILAFLSGGMAEVYGHGSVGDPVSRVYRIFLENPETPLRPVSEAAISVGGTQPFYDWSEVNRLAPDYASGDIEVYRQLIPDGQLASAGRAKYAGLDLVRSDWPATPVNAGLYPVVFDAHVPHDPSYFKAFISRPGWGPDQVLGWDDLEPLLGPENFVRDGALYRFNVDFPNRTGHHVLFVVWQRIDPAGEVFFSLSDIDFGDGSGYGNPENGSGAYDAFPTDYLSDDIDASVDFTVQNDWGSGFTAEFSILNQGDTLINGWSLEFELDRNITSWWNAQLIRREGDRYTVINDDWNGSIASGGTVSFGFQADPGGVEESDLGLVQLNGVTVRGGDPSDEAEPDPSPEPEIPALFIADVEVDEGNEGVTSVCVTVSLSSVPEEMVHVMVHTEDGSASAGSDYVSHSSMVHFSPGQIQSQVCIDVVGDGDVESDEIFELVWTDIEGATLEDQRSSVTIRNDDQAPVEENEAAVTWRVDDDWGSGYTATVTVWNHTPDRMESWVVSFDLGVSLVNYWNTENVTQSGSTLTFSNASWNGVIEPGNSVSFGFQAASSADLTPENIRLNGVLVSGSDPGDGPVDDPIDDPIDDPMDDPVTDDSVLSVYIRDAWGSGFTADASLTLANPVSGWQLGFDFPYQITQIWNAEIVSYTSGRYVVKDAGYNANLGAGAEILFGFGGSGSGLITGQTIYPSHVTLNGQGSDGEPVDDGGPDEGEGESPEDPEGGIPDPEPAEPGEGKDQTGLFNYGEAMQKSLFFYDAQRSGDLPEDFRVAWRGDSALDDGADVGVDLSGGFYDAGDHVKFGLPGAFAFTLLGWSAVDQRNSWVQTGQWDELLDLLRWETDYLMRAHVRDAEGETLEFYGQVGNGGADHGFWGPPELMTMARPAMKVTRALPGSDLTAESASTLAVASMAFADSDPAYAAVLLDHARALYRFADTYRGFYMNGIPDAWGYYPSNHYIDELVWGALWLYRATGESEFLAKAEQDFANTLESGFMSEDPPSGYPWTLVWDDKKYGVVILLAALTGEDKYKAYAEKWLDYWSVGYNGKRIAYSPGGQAFLDQWGSLRYSSNTAFLALWYADVVRDYDGRYRDLGLSQINYALGDNPEGRSYVVGFGVNAPVNPHHRAAHGSLTNNINLPVETQHTLYGALVGGPGQANDGASYVDDRQDYRANEVALDYNAGYTAALAILFEEFGGYTLLNFPAGE